MINKDQVIARTQELYEQERGYVWDGFKAPEQRPQLSRQVKSLAAALVEAINKSASDKP